MKRIKDAGYSGGYTQVKEVVAELRQHSQEVFVPLKHEPSEGRVDFGQAWIKCQGTLEKIVYFALSLPHSERRAARGTLFGARTSNDLHTALGALISAIGLQLDVAFGDPDS